MATLAPERELREAPGARQRVAWAVRDAMTVAKRNLIAYWRTPALIFFAVIQPVIFVLLFRYVFGGAIHTNVPGGYVDYLTPGIIGQSAAFASFGTAIGLAREIQKGVVDRYRSMPMARSAVLTGRLLADLLRMTVTVLVLLGVSTAVGFRFHNGALPAVGMVVLAVAFGMAITSVSAYLGFVIKDEEAVGSFGLIWLFPLTFVSSAFVPVASMPGWLQVFASNQPVTIVIDEMRALALGGPLGQGAWESAVCIAGILAVFIPLAVRAYRRV